MSAAPAVPILTEEECQRRLRAKRPPELNYYAFYSSFLGGIVTDPALMAVPLDDHMVHRGHAVFDTATLTHGRLYRLRIHLDRLEASARKARIPLPMPREGLAAVIAQTCAASGRRDASVRYWLSAGAGDFGIVPPKAAEPTFYVLVFEGVPFDPRHAGQGISEVTIADVPLKPAYLATLKSNNYLLNALTAMTAKERGGTYGILLDNGFVAEGCTLNVAIVDPTGVFRTPPFDVILDGTTVRRAMEIAAGLEGVVRGVQQVPIRAEELFAAREVLLLAGDCHVYPVVRLDGRAVGDGRPGPVALALQAAISNEMERGDTEDFTPVPYAEPHQGV